MPLLDPRDANLAGSAEAKTCERHSLLDELGSERELRYLQAQINDQAATTLKQVGWFLHVSLKMRKDRLDPEKLSSLAAEVGPNNVDFYLVGALLYLMGSYGIITVEVTGST